MESRFGEPERITITNRAGGEGGAGEPAIIQFGIDNGVAAGVTRYMKGGGDAQAVEINAAVVMPRNGTAGNLYVESGVAPGAGETYTYTLMINGIASAITCQIAGAAATTANDIVNTAAVVAGQHISLRVVTSGAAVQGRHFGGVTIT